MKRFHLLLLLLTALAVGCDSSGPDDDDTPAPFDAQQYVGIYTGTVQTDVVTPDDTNTDRQAVAVTIDAADGDVSITLAPAAGEPTVLAGTYDDAGATIGFSEDGSAIVIGVDADGDVDGIGLVALGPLRLNAEVDGRITRSALTMTVDLDVTQGNEALPVGSTISLTLAAER